MRPIAELRALAAHGRLTEAIVREEINERTDLVKTLVGTLYPSIVWNEIEEIESLPSRPATLWDHLLDKP